MKASTVLDMARRESDSICRLLNYGGSNARLKQVYAVLRARAAELSHELAEAADAEEERERDQSATTTKETA